MVNSQNTFFDFVMGHTQDGKQEAMAAALKEYFKPPQEGKFDPDAFHKGIECVTSMLKPEAVKEFQKMMNPFADLEDSSEALELKNLLAQPNKYKWKSSTPSFSKDEMRAATACAKKAHDMKCDCWNTHCVIFGECKKCILFHLYMKQFPTCQRSLLGDLEEHYIAFSRDTNK